MKLSIWDLLTGITLLGILCLVGAFGVLLVNPNVPFNPLPPGGIVKTIPTIALPQATATTLGLPPTWTPVPLATETPRPESTQVSATETGPARLPSATLIPTFTPVILPTFTPSRAAPAGRSGGSCAITGQSPADDTFQSRDSEFSVIWTIKNTSQDTWRADSVDLRFMSGDRFHLSKDALDLSQDIGPGAAMDLTIKMQAPNAPGAYVSNWAFLAGTKPLCQFYIRINVQ